MANPNYLIQAAQVFGNNNIGVDSSGGRHSHSIAITNTPPFRVDGSPSRWTPRTYPGHPVEFTPTPEDPVTFRELNLTFDQLVESASSEPSPGPEISLDHEDNKTLEVILLSMDVSDLAREMQVSEEEASRRLDQLIEKLVD